MRKQLHGSRAPAPAAPVPSPEVAEQFVAQHPLAKDPGSLLALQRHAGNAAVSRAVRRQAGPGALQRDPLPTGDDYQAARRSKQEWVAQGVRGPEQYAASTNRGGFQVAYVPDVGDGALNVALKGAVDFQDGIELFMGVWAVANQPTAPVAAATMQINQLPMAQRAAAVAPWRWTASERTAFMTQFADQVTAVWQRKFRFRCTKQFWGDLGADVNVRVEIHEGDKTDGDHMSLKSFKIAAGASAGNVGVVRSGTGTDPHDNVMELNSTDVMARSDIQLTTNGTFDPGADTFAGSGAADARLFGRRYASGGGPRCGHCSAELAAAAGTTIHCRVQGSAPDAEASARARHGKIVTELVAGGMSDAATRAQFEFGGTGDGFTLVVGTGAQQVVAAHEAGHMFGMGDEYTAPFSGTGKTRGSAVDGSLGQQQGLPGAVAENTDSIMSVGNAVKPQHYATFLEALKHVTGMTEWEFGAPTGVVPPGVDGPVNPGSVPGGVPAGGQPEPASAYA